MGRIVALANQKGGVGKTTTAINLGAALAGLGKRVLIFDFDPQANSTAGLGMRPGVDDGRRTMEDGGGARAASESSASATGDSAQTTPQAEAAQGGPRPGSIAGTSYEVVVGGVRAESVVVATTIENLSIIAATPGLAGAEVELVPMMAREFRLKRALEPLREKFDYIIIDCPPSLGLLTVNALAAADEVIIPVQCEYLALEGLSQLTSTLELVRRNLNPSLKLRGLLLTMFDARTNLSQQVADEVRAHFPQTFKTVIPRSVRLSEAPSHGLSIFQYDGSSRAAKAYADLGAEVVGAE